MCINKGRCLLKLQFYGYSWGYSCFLRNQQEKGFVDSRIKQDENKQNAVIASFKRRIEKFEQRNKDLKEEKIKLSEKENERLTEYFTKI